MWSTENFPYDQVILIIVLIVIIITSNIIHNVAP